MPLSAVRRYLLAGLAVLAIGACAPMVPIQTASFKPSAAGAPDVQLRLRQAVQITLPTQYVRTLPEGSRWRRVGTLEQGDVYRPIDTIFTIEGRQVHEAYLVISHGALVGFYLPGESSYSALASPISLPTGEIN